MYNIASILDEKGVKSEEKCFKAKESGIPHMVSNTELKSNVIQVILIT